MPVATRLHPDKIKLFSMVVYSVSLSCWHRTTENKHKPKTDARTIFSRQEKDRTKPAALFNGRSFWLDTMTLAVFVSVVSM